MTTTTETTDIDTTPEAAPAKTRAVRTIRPRCDVFEHAEGYRILAELPGVPTETLELEVAEGVLSLAGERELMGTTFRYERSFRIGDAVDQAAITAALDRGVLTIELPKAASARPRRIAVGTAA